MEDIVLIDKPKGITSFDVIRKLRGTHPKVKLGHVLRPFNKTQGRPEEFEGRRNSGHARLKIGHAGTLDPLASGLLIIGMGKGTKKLAQFLKLPKVYEVIVLLGEQRTTGDMEGKVVHSKKVEGLNIEKVEATLSGMVGNVELAVPKYSAIKVGGERLYKKARQGKDFEPPKKVMKIIALKLKGDRKDGNRHILDITMEVGSGAYVRSIAEELGRRLGYPATVKELRRTKVGEFDIKDAKKLEEF